MRACLFEDRGAIGLAPLSLTRPTFDLLCGAGSLAEQQLRIVPRAEVGVLVRPEMADLVRYERPDFVVNNTAWLRAGPLVLINGRWLPPLPDRRIATDSPCIALVNGAIAYAVVTPELLPVDPLLGFDDCLDRLKRTLPHVTAGGMVCHHLWDLIHANASRLCQEFEYRDRTDDDDSTGWRPAGCGLVGPADRLLIDPLAQIDPLVVFDTTHGPVIIEAGAVVTAFSRFEGPCHVGAGTHVLGAKIRAGTTLGPCCRIGGEVECSIVQEFTNKYHDGFLGHSYVGSWVNMGAGCQVSDLRNDYGEVTVHIGGHEIPTGETKVGSMIGDHAKIGIGSLLNTGTVMGSFSQALPAGGLLPKSIPSFCTTSHERLAEQTDFESLLGVAATVMARRGRALTPAHEDLYRTVFAASAAGTPPGVARTAAPADAPCRLKAVFVYITLMSINAPLNRKLRMGLVGGGQGSFIGRVHAIAACLDGRAEVVAGALSSDPAKAKASAPDYGIAPDRAYGSYQDMLTAEVKRPDKIDFVSVTTPNHTHYEIAKAAAEAGFNVVCDKPLTFDLAQAEDLARVVQKTNVVFAVTHNYTGYPLVRQARAMVQSGELGEIQAVRANYIQGWLRTRLESENQKQAAWRTDPKRSGAAGCFGDIGTHVYNLGRFISGLAPDSISCQLKIFEKGRALDDYGTATIRYTNGALGTVTASQISHGRENDLRIEIDGTKGSIEWHQEEPNKLIVRRNGQPHQIYTRAGGSYLSDVAAASSRLPSGHPEAFLEAFANVYTAAFDDIVKRIGAQSFDLKNTLYPNVADGVDGMNFITQCVASSNENGAWKSMKL